MKFKKDNFVIYYILRYEHGRPWMNHKDMYGGLVGDICRVTKIRPFENVHVFNFRTKRYCEYHNSNLRYATPIEIMQWRIKNE